MGSVGTPEILVILLLALILLGPERLPGAARTAGRWVAEIRKITGSLQAEVQDVMEEVMRPVQETASVATESFTSTFQAAAAPVEGTATTTSSAPSSSDEPLGAEPKAADVPLPAFEAPPSFPAPPTDPSLN